HLHAIARRNHHSFLHARLRQQQAQSVRQATLRNREALAHLNWSRLMVDAAEQKFHCMNLCMLLTKLAAQAPIAARKATEHSTAARRPRHPAFQRVYSRTMYTAHMKSESTTFGSAKNRAPKCASARPA